jgi:hypothetical protein
MWTTYQVRVLSKTSQLFVTRLGGDREIRVQNMQNADQLCVIRTDHLA